MSIPLSPLEQTLKELIAIPTVTGDIPAARQLFNYVREQLTSYDLYIHEYNDDGYPLLLLTTQDTKSPQILFVAHVDVVPGPASLFTMETTEDRLVGRGVWDMKFAVAGYIELVRVLGDQLKKYDFGILLTSDEEKRNNNVNYALEQAVRPQCAILPDGAQDWQVESTSKGALTVKLIAEGVTAHGSRPWDGKSASLLLLDVLAEIRQWFSVESPTSDTLNISMIEAGQAVNQLPVEATAHLDMRFMTFENMDLIQKKLAMLADRLQLQWEIVAHFPPLTHDLTDPFIASFMQSTTTVAGALETGSISYGASEAASFMRDNIPCIVTRPTGGGHHGDDEWVNRQSLSLMVPIIIDYLKRLQG